ncbi:hypothetical protein Y695_00098 [Hydrogenophaga sp. T4]|nr:hypothetical protein Y695_00098 [Hydrogenophaga sp. T4]
MAPLDSKIVARPCKIPYSTTAPKIFDQSMRANMPTTMVTTATIRKMITASSPFIQFRISQPTPVTTGKEKAA